MSLEMPPTSMLVDEMYTDINRDPAAVFVGLAVERTGCPADKIFKEDLLAAFDVFIANSISPRVVQTHEKLHCIERALLGDPLDHNSNYRIRGYPGRRLRSGFAAAVPVQHRVSPEELPEFIM